MSEDAPAPEPDASLADDDRAVSTTLGYTLTLSMTAVLIAGLLTAGGGLIEDQRNTVAADELSVSGQQLAAGFEDADRLSATTDDGTVRVNVWLPQAVAGGGYTVTIQNEPTAADQPARAKITLRADDVDVTRNVSFRTENPAANRTVPGGPVTIRYNDTDGDGTRELLLEEQRSISPNVADPASFAHEELVYVDADTGELKSVAPDNTVTSYGVDAAAIGPKQADLDGDGLREVPYVTSANELRMVDEDGQTQTLATGAAYSAGGNTSLIGVGNWSGSTSVFYLNSSDTVNGHPSIYRVGADGSPEQVTAGGSGIDAMAVGGVGDMNDDGDADLVYVAGGTEQATYVDGGSETAITSVDTGPGYGIGDARQFDTGERDGMPYVTANEVRIYRGSASSALATGAANTSVAGVDWVNDDGTLELVYVDATDGTLRYVTLSGMLGTVDDADGNSITVDEDKGVA